MNRATPIVQNDYSMYAPAEQKNSPHSMPTLQNNQAVTYMPRHTLPCNNNPNWQSGIGAASTNENDIKHLPEQNTMNTNQTPESLSNPYFWPAYLKTFVGYWARLDFLIGNQTQQVIGKLLDVGASYIVLEALEPDTLIMCDLFSLKFATIIYGDDLRKIANSMR